MHEKTLLYSALTATALATGYGVVKARQAAHDGRDASEIAPVSLTDSSKTVAQSEAPIRLTASDGTGLKLVAMNAAAVVDDPLAFTELRLVFENPQDRVLEGTFRITLPQGASLSRFAMKVNDTWQEGEVVELATARRVYEDFLHRRQDPALMEQAGGNEFSARVFPIPARGKKEIIVAYSESVEVGSAYRLPLKGLPNLGALDIQVHAAGAKAAEGGGRTDATFALHQRQFTPGEDFVAPAKQLPRSGGLRSGDLALMRVVPFASSRPDPVASAIFLVDTSASRALGLAEQTRLLQQVLAKLPPAAAITVACFDQEVVQVYDGAASGFSEREVSSIIARGALGASDLEQALDWAVVRAKKSKAKRVVLIGDGVATAGETDPQKLKLKVEALRPSGVDRVDAIAVGGIRDDATLRSVVRGVLDKDGTVLDASLGPDGLARRLGESTSSGVPVKVEGARWSWPRTLDGFQAGDEVLVYAEIDPATPVRVDVGGQQFAPDLRAVDRPLVERAWAKAKIQSLVEAPVDDPTSTKNQIIALSTRHRVLSPHTAMLVLETDNDYARYGIDRRANVDILRIQDGRIAVTLSDRGNSGTEKNIAAPPAFDSQPTTTPTIQGKGAATTATTRPAEAGGRFPREEADARSQNGPRAGGGGSPGDANQGTASAAAAPTMAPVPVAPVAPAAPAAEPAPFISESLSAKDKSKPDLGRAPAEAPRARPPSKPSRIDSDDPWDSAEDRKTPSPRPLAAPKPLPNVPPPPPPPPHATATATPTVATPSHGHRAPPPTTGWSPGPRPAASATSRAAPTGTVRATSLVVQDGLVDGDAQRVLRTALPQFRACYISSLATDRSLSGQIDLRVAVDAVGNVQTVDVTRDVSNGSLHACVVHEAKALRFPAPGIGYAHFTVSLELVPGQSSLADDVVAMGGAAPAMPKSALPYEGRFRIVMEHLSHGEKDRAFDEANKWRAEEPGDVMALVALGESLEAKGDVRTAARAYGSILELFSFRADSRRFAGERLERLHDAAAIKLAADSYAKAAEQRPDHPASHRLVAFTLLKAGEHEKAFEAMKKGALRTYPAGRFRGVDRILKEDLGLIAAAWSKAQPGRRAEIQTRLREAGGIEETNPSLRFVLNWETDANDVDFHIYDGRGGHAYYSSPQLPSGGELYADVTTGYGPECFTIRGAAAQRAYPYQLQAHYYSRGPMGYGMGKLEIIDHDGHGNLSFEERPFVVMIDHAYVDLGKVERSDTAKTALK